MREYEIKGGIDKGLCAVLSSVENHVYNSRGQSARQIVNAAQQLLRGHPNGVLVVHENMEKLYIFTQRMRNRVHVVADEEWNRIFSTSTIPDCMIFICSQNSSGPQSILGSYVCGNWDDDRMYL